MVPLHLDVYVLMEWLMRGYRSQLGLRNIFQHKTEILGFASAKVILDHYINNKDAIIDKVNKISKLITSSLDGKGIEYRNIGIMTAVKTGNDYSLQVMKSLEKLGILTYIYINKDEEGLSLMPQFIIDLNSLRKAMYLIVKKIKV